MDIHNGFVGKGVGVGCMLAALKAHKERNESGLCVFMCEVHCKAGGSDNHAWLHCSGWLAPLLI